MNNKVRVAVVGIGNCASSLVQGIYKYADMPPGLDVPGIMHHSIGGYEIGDIEVVAAFDVDVEKVGKDVSEAIFSGQNNTITFQDVPKTGVIVQNGPLIDGIGKYLSAIISVSEDEIANVADVLVDREVDVLINYLPVGSDLDTFWYVKEALRAGVAVVNCIPVFIASDEHWSKLFVSRKIPIIGDDIKSQVGATIVHRVLANLFKDRGVRIDRTYQLNFGGNTDFLNMLERERLESKKISKTRAVTSQVPYLNSVRDVHVGPSDHVPWLHDRKWCHIRIEGTTFGDVPLNLELKLEVWDSPNSAGVVIDAIRCAKLALNLEIGGPLLAPSAYYMKSPPTQFTDDISRDMLEDFIANGGR